MFVLRTLHLYLADQFHPLDELLKEQENATKLNQEEQNALYGVNVWVIYVVGEDKRKDLLTLLKKSPLRFDSYVFEFFDPIQGK